MNDSQDFLAHFGVKGMKWGVRNAEKRNARTERLSNNTATLKDKLVRDFDLDGGNKNYSFRGETFKKRDKVVGNELGVDITKGDKKWRKQLNNPKVLIQIHNKMADGINKDLSALNKKYDNKDLGYDPNRMEYTTKAGKQYLKDYENLGRSHAEKAVKDIFGNSPSENWTATAWYSLDHGLRVEIVPNQVTHDSFDVTDTGIVFTFNTKINTDGFFDLIVKDSLEHDSLNDFLAHYGVRGMKWGVRKSSSHPSSEDAATAASYKRRAQTQGIHTLSNKELQTYINRANLEQQFNRLNERKKNAGSKFVGDVLKEIGKQEAKKILVSKTAEYVGAFFKMTRAVIKAH